VQLAHACHRWGFASVIPASWGEELLASETIRRCALRENRPAIHCACPRVAERLGAHAARLDDTIIWLATPPVATARYVRAHAGPEAVHITYAGGCPGAADASIDQRVTPTELMMAIGARGIDVAAQPTVFEDISPPDRRRHFSAPAGLPDPQHLWGAAAFRVAQPSDVDLSIGIAQLLLTEERLLIDLGALVGCSCRAGSLADDSVATLRSPTPVVRDGVVDVTRAAPAVREAQGDERRVSLSEAPEAVAVHLPRQGAWPRRHSPSKPIFRRQVAWKRQTPRPGAIVARSSASWLALPDRLPILQRPVVRAAIVTAIALATLMLGMLIGMRYASADDVVTGAARIDSPALSSRSRSP
jgi:hypothetical protein